ncbi:MAG: GntR family transcriptional regulator [Clostridiales bacterium]|nr:GntR family transcriptional regulator [Clostridiales bacterium]
MQQYKSKVDIIYELLIENIEKSVYRQGDRLIISKIAKQYNVSEIPVREALRRLESEGYIKTKANQGAVVSGFNKEKLISIFELKGVLEGYATRKSIDYQTPNSIKELSNKNKQIKKALDDHDIEKYSELNMQFHLGIYKCIPQKELYNMICDLWKKWSITKSVFDLVPQRIEASIQEHDEIIRLIDQRKYDEVEQYVRSHKFRAGYEFVRQLDERQSMNSDK